MIFPPGAGGNHLANIISVGNRFSLRFDINNYHNLTGNAHVSNIKNLQIDQDTIDQLQSTSNVLCSHLAEYLWVQDFVNQLPNRKYLVLEFGSALSDTVRKRITKMYPAYQQEYFLQEISTLYSQQCVQRLTGETDFFRLDVNVLFQEDVSDLLNSLEQDLHLNLDKSVIQELHDKWLQTLKQSPD